MRNMHDCYMKADYVRISLTRGKYRYQLVGTYWYHSSRAVKFAKCEIYGSTEQPGMGI